jgi:hypothetical protein
MISIFDDDGNRLSVAWNGIEFNDPTLTRYDTAGKRLEGVIISTPVNFHSESIDDIVKNGGGIEFYNPRVGTRILNLRGSIRADTESELMSEIMAMQRAFHPMLLQGTLALNRAGTLTWPPPSGLPDWVRAKPLTFTRCLPKTTDPTNFPDGLIDLQYHVIPLQLPDPMRASVQQGLGVDYEAQFLIMDGGRSFAQTATTLTGDGSTAWTWGQAPVWPRISFEMDGVGNAALTITTTQGHMGTALVLDASGLANNDVIDIDTWDRSIWKNDVRDSSIYVSGDYPIFRGNGNTTVTWTNTTNVTAASNTCVYRQSDYV